MRIAIQKEINVQPRVVRWVEAAVLRQLRKLTKCRVPAAAALKKVELSILLTDDENIKKLNKRWRKKNKPTDVLSFPQLSTKELKAISRIYKHEPKMLEAWLLGDIVISLPTASRQAIEKNHSLKYELEWLCAHGILHLLGFDHEIGPTQARTMRRWEKHLLTR